MTNINIQERITNIINDNIIMDGRDVIEEYDVSCGVIYFKSKRKQCRPQSTLTLTNALNDKIHDLQCELFALENTRNSKEEIKNNIMYKIGDIKNIIDYIKSIE